MLIVFLACLVLMAVTTVMHYEVLRVLNDALPKIGIPSRSKLLVVIFVTFLAHLLEMAVWGVALFSLADYPGVGSLTGNAPLTLMNCIYFSAETYTSLGFGDVTPVGHMRLLVGVEALNGLLLIAWSASFTYLSMERFWSHGKGPARN
jgi:Ion channel